jgi:hypothetical protein
MTAASNARCGRRSAGTERNAIVHETNKTRPRCRQRKVRVLTELNLFQIDSHDASFSFIPGLTSRLTSAVLFSWNHSN